jgi:hypothetical protein
MAKILNTTIATFIDKTDRSIMVEIFQFKDKKSERRSMYVTSVTQIYAPSHN